MLKILIAKYKETINNIEGSADPVKNLIAIIEFYKLCNKNSSFRIFQGFAGDFIPHLVDIFMHHDINFIDPEYMLYANDIFNIALSGSRYEDEFFLKSSEEAVRNLKLKLIKAYFNLGEVKNGLDLIKEYSGINPSVIDSVNTQTDKKKLKKHSDVQNLNLPAEIQQPGNFYLFKVLNEIKDESDRILKFSDNTANILFTSSDSQLGIQTGLVFNCTIDVIHDKNISSYNIVFENIFDYRDKKFSEYISFIKKNFELLLFKYNLKPPTRKSFRIHFEKSLSIYRGGSFISGIVLLMFVKYYNLTGKRTILSISNAAAFTGVLDERGSMAELPAASLAAKIKSAFFSWIRCVVIPESNFDEAQKISGELKLKYPGKIFNVFSAKSVSDLLDNPAFLKKSKIGLMDFLAANNKAAVMGIALLLFLVSLTLIFRNWDSTFPASIPEIKSARYLLYTPSLENKWIFKNSGIQNDTLNFGETAVGDMWYPMIEFRNVSNKPEKFKFAIEGKDKDDFEIVWRDEPGQNSLPEIKPELPQRIYLKFRPLSLADTGAKSAKLIISCSDENKEIFLKAKSGIYKNGYSLKFSNPEDYFIINNKSNFLGKSFTLDFWIKPLEFENVKDFSTPVGFLADENGSFPKFHLGIDFDSCLYLSVNKNSSGTHDKVKTTNKIQFDKWNHVSLKIDNNKVFFTLNNVLTRAEITTGVTLIEDYIYFGLSDYPERLEKKARHLGFLKFILSDFKIYGINNSVIADFDFDECNYETVYDLSDNNITGRFLGGPVRVLDYYTELKPAENQTSASDNCIEISERGLMLCSKNFFENNKGFTISMDAFLYRSFSGPRRLLSIFSRPEYDIHVEFDTAIAVLYAADKINSITKQIAFPFHYWEEWHRFTFRYNPGINTFAFYIDTVKIGEIDSIKTPFELSKWFYGTGFGNYTFFYAHRIYTEKSLLDNIVVYNAPVPIEKAFIKDTANAVAAWDFENIKGNLAIDNLKSTPAFLWQTYRIIPKP